MAKASYTIVIYTVAETVLDEMNSKLGDDPEIVKCRTQLDFSRM